MSAGAPALRGFGLGLRSAHYAEFLDPDRPGGPPRVDWLEVISENHMVPGGRPMAVLERLRSAYPMVLHGVSLSIGGTDPLDEAYLAELARLAERIEPAWISDHLCWTGVDHRNLHDLLPLPLTEAALKHTAGRIARVQERLKRRLVIENVSSYVRLAADEMSEAEFLAALLERADCELLLDVNNLHVNSVNHGFDAQAFLARLPAARVRQIHLAGHETAGDLRVDTHDRPVCAAVWALYRAALRRFGPVPTMIERDDSIPPLAELESELDVARAIASETAAPGGRAFERAGCRDAVDGRAERAATAPMAAPPQAPSSILLRIQQRDLDAAVRLGVDVPGLLRPPAHGLGTYRHAYVARLVAALRDNFEVLARAMGDEAFVRLARAFLAAQPSRTPSIRWFGAGLVAFMQTHDGCVPHPCLVDLARMEWALRTAFDAADAAPLAPAELAACPASQWPMLCFVPHPSVQLIELQWRVEPAHRALRAAIDAADADAALPEPEAGAHALLVWRAGQQPRWRSLEGDEATLVRKALAGAPFAALCAAAQLRHGDAAAGAVAAWLGQWVAQGWLAGLGRAQAEEGSALAEADAAGGAASAGGKAPSVAAAS